MLLSLLLLSLLLLVMLGFYVSVAAPRNAVHQTFALFVFCLALWTIKDIAFWGFAPRAGAAGWWATVSFLFALLLQYPLVIFAWLYPENNPVPRARAAVLFAPSPVFAPAVLAGWMWNSVGFTNDGRFTISLTPLAYALGIYTYAVFLYVCVLLAAKQRRYKNQIWGQQLAAILWALILTGALITLASIALPLAGFYALLPISSVFVLPGVLIYAYAISNFKLFSLQSALDQFRLFPITYKVALSIAAVAVVSFLLLQIPIVWWSFGAGEDTEAWRRYVVFSVIAALLPNLILVALIIRSISRPLRRLTEAAVAVARGAYGTEVDLDSNDEVGLLARSFNEMSRKMRVDIERLREMSDQLLRTEKLAAVGTLAAGVAHEVNNPLASISSLVQILHSRSQRNGADEETIEMLRLISGQITRITQVTADLMDFARARPAQRTLLDVRSVIEASLRLASFDKEFKKLHLTLQWDEAAPPLSADADGLQQVFLNLFFNARDAMRNNEEEVGNLRVTTRFLRRANELHIEIADNGTGIKPEHRAQLFDPFFTTKPAGDGTGLGLAVCYGIITAHNGRIEIEPNKGHGTIVRVCLPTISSH